MVGINFLRNANGWGYITPATCPTHRIVDALDRPWWLVMGVGWVWVGGHGFATREHRGAI
jgi:hypothetical protein